MSPAVAHQSDAAFLRSLGQKRLVQILSKRHRINAFLAKLDVGLRPGASNMLARTAMRIYFQACALCGVEHQTAVANNIIISIGAASEDDARRKIAIVNAVEGKALEHQIDDTAAWLDRLLSERPDLRERAQERLAPVLRAALALNGHANGEAK